MNDTELKRFTERTEITPTCWLWTGTTAQGYGYMTAPSHTGSRRSTTVHRLAYEHFIGPIPDGLHIDHLCRVRNCVNPAHLEPVTCRENIMRGTGVAAINAHKTQCTHGHPFDEANTYVGASGERECRTCRRQRMAAKYASGYIAPSRRKECGL